MYDQTLSKIALMPSHISKTWVLNPCAEDDLLDTVPDPPPVAGDEPRNDVDDPGDDFHGAIDNLHDAREDRSDDRGEMLHQPRDDREDRRNECPEGRDHLGFDGLDEAVESRLDRRDDDAPRLLQRSPQVPELGPERRRRLVGVDDSGGEDRETGDDGEDWEQ
jgi:hypothetical protein